MTNKLYIIVNLFALCILLIAKPNRCSSEFEHKYSSVRPSYSISISKAENWITPQKCNGTDDFATLVHKSLQRKNNFDVSQLQELMVQGFQILCIWSQHIKEKLKIQSELKFDERPFNLSGVFVLPSKYGEVVFGNLTLVNFPISNEKMLATPLNSECVHVFKTSYQAKWNKTTIRGQMELNGTRTDFSLVYQNATLILNDIKTCSKTGQIFNTPIGMEFNFDSFVAYTNETQAHWQDVDFLLDTVTPYLLDQIIAKDTSGRISNARAIQNVKISEFYKENVLRLMSTVLAYYLRYRYKKSYRLSADQYTARLPDTIEYVQIDGLDRCKMCGSSMQLVPQADKLTMKLTFSISFSDDAKKFTSLTVCERYNISTWQNRTIVVKKLLFRLEFSSALQLDTTRTNKLHFYAKSVKAEIVERYRFAWYDSLKSKLNAFLSEILAEIVLQWILYEDQLTLGNR